MVKEKGGKITFRAPTSLRDVVKAFIERDLHMNESDFYRDAAREKIQRDAPELYKKMFSGNIETSAERLRRQEPPSFLHSEGRKRPENRGSEEKCLK